jgi:hypothetical protein
MPRALTVVLGVSVLAVATLVGVRVGTADAVRGLAAKGGCTHDYDYAGVQDNKVHYGIRATIKVSAFPDTSQGVVAGWVGVGGPGLGPNGVDEWLQAGYAKYQTGPLQIYYEYTKAGALPAYHTVQAKVSKGEQHRVTVLAMQSNPNDWKVWVDNKAVTGPLLLKQSGKRFEPQAEAETNNADVNQCNTYHWIFTGIQIATAPGGSWAATKAGAIWHDKYNSATRTSNDSFDARSLSVSAQHAEVLPLLPFIASRLTGEKFTAECAKQQTAVRVGSPRHLLLSDNICEKLLGYTIAQPFKPSTRALRGAFADIALEFTRGVARAAGVTTNLDCRAVNSISTMLRLMGVTAQQGHELRADLLRRHPALRRKIASC